MTIFWGVIMTKKEAYDKNLYKYDIIEKEYNIFLNDFVNNKEMILENISPLPEDDKKIRKYIIEKLTKITDEELAALENYACSEKISDIDSVKHELDKVIKKLNEDPARLIAYYELLEETDKLLRVVEFDPSVMSTIKRNIVILDIACGINIRLYSGLIELKNYSLRKNNYVDINLTQKKEKTL